MKGAISLRTASFASSCSSSCRREREKEEEGEGGETGEEGGGEREGVTLAKYTHTPKMKMEYI
jgi:hypothetical protein